jgi:hypothetical protein
LQTRVVGSTRRIANGSSTHSSRQSLEGWGWVCRSAARLLKLMTDGYGSSRIAPRALCFNSPYHSKYSTPESDASLAESFPLDRAGMLKCSTKQMSCLPRRRVPGIRSPNSSVSFAPPEQATRRRWPPEALTELYAIANYLRDDQGGARRPQGRSTEVRAAACLARRCAAR